MDIRKIRPADAQAFLDMRQQMDGETNFMMLEPGERQIDAEEQRQRIRKALEIENPLILVVEQDEQLVGFLSASRGEFHRNQHTAYIVVGLLQPYTGQGIGASLFTEMEKWARQKKLHRLELTVMTHNSRAVALYKKVGFAIEGTKKHSLLVDGVYVDEFYMAKLLD